MLIGVLLICIGQVSVKAAQRPGAKRYPLGNLLHPGMLGGLGLLLTATFLNSYALGDIPLGTFTAWNATAYPLTVIGAAWLLKERLNTSIVIGVLLVFSGVVVFSL
jgi:drug/metabolite transporter (DMT)-like permease